MKVETSAQRVQQELEIVHEEKRKEVENLMHQLHQAQNENRLLQNKLDNKEEVSDWDLKFIIKTSRGCGLLIQKIHPSN